MLRHPSPRSSPLYFNARLILLYVLLSPAFALLRPALARTTPRHRSCPYRDATTLSVPVRPARRDPLLIPARSRPEPETPYAHPHAERAPRHRPRHAPPPQQPPAPPLARRRVLRHARRRIRARDRTPATPSAPATAVRVDREPVEPAQVRDGPAAVRRACVRCGAQATAPADADGGAGHRGALSHAEAAPPDAGVLYGGDVARPCG